ncbi:Carbamoyltransferase HypF [Salinivirga cyanobacteriivorans]|uniref:Carbamoyltransferase n=1 Tax=Salinivirga cyanobacteriivorans TaxID=1307839 RepID=A0A0S2HXX6_9BACT|nr:carbamoyltransferase HypF [Salinivirga cyanobacteriivorans]ALO14919.1 Carbamoyltransferase HypF [Salinivirga cyanobacteriivorans]
MYGTSPTYRVIIKGLVQGVGFRPFVYRIAKKYNISGWVRNTPQGVEIEMQGAEYAIKLFMEAIHKETPPAAKIDYSEVQNTNPQPTHKTFRIIKSSGESNDITELCPDIAVCEDCLSDIQSQPHRINYPFINCTNCGPRFSIIKNIPYDRPKTTMNSFQMCSQCYNEYTKINDRRFHAQPIACNNCGPVYTLHFNGSENSETASILKQTAQIIDNGGIVLIKGIGGFFICGDAYREEVTRKIRKIKKRDNKPFAVMLSGLNALKKHTQPTQQELKSLKSWRRPVVLLKQKTKGLAKNINEGLKNLGCILPYMPFHYLLFEQLKTDTILYTSANFSNTPIIKENQFALEYFTGKVDAILTYNRTIENRVDDSVIQVIQDKPQLLRRARGYTPRSIQLAGSEHKIVALGADQKGCFSLGMPGKAIMSQHIGALDNAETFNFFLNTIDHFRQLFHFGTPEAIAVDAHPDYFSRQHGLQLSKNFNVPLLSTFHHHAHIASVLAEHQITEKVIGISMDGTGYGTDGHIWGSEFLIADIREFERRYHFEYMPMPGGESAIKHPWKMAVAIIVQTFKNGDDLAFQYFGKSIGKQQVKLVIESIKKNINCPLTCGAGRLFDAVAALLGICLISGYEAEAPMKLESLVKNNSSEAYTFKIEKNHVSFNEMFHQIIDDMQNNISPSEIATRFHQTLVEVIVETALILRKQYDIHTVALSGGLFQNRFVMRNTVKKLKEKHFKCLVNENVPPNDGGIALGQLAIANARMRSI